MPMNLRFNRARRPSVPLPAMPPVLHSVASSAVSSVSSGPSSPEDNWETLDISSTEYARMRREMMQLISDLRSLGAETMMDLPSIVVIGGQSAGKSSLVEAVTGVTVPRDSGTCTRQLSDGMHNVQQRNDLVLEISFGPTITNSDDMEIWLRRAQAAILNPDLPPESFHGKTAQELRNLNSDHSLKFSRNVVSIFIEDPSATDLSFFDLPGLIQNEDEEVVNLVRELTESYINRPDTIILTTIPMSDDMQNQQSVTLARHADPDGERTIGILTKPDLLGEGAVGARQRWVDVIEGRQHTLRHGYYCVRLPDDAQRSQGLPRAAFHHMTARYFDTTSPWNRVTTRGRFGIPAFVTDISALLVNHINRTVPRLRQNVERLLNSCLEEINTLPKPLEDDPQIEVLGRVNAFCDAFKGAVSGSNDKTLAQRNRALYTIFSRDIQETSPDFRPFEDPSQYLPIDALDSERCTEARNYRLQPMGVYEIRKTIKESTGWELPGNVPYEAKTRLINQFTILWSVPAKKCLTSINDVLDDIIQQLVKTYFGRFAVLHNMITDLIRPDIEEYKNKALAAVKETLELESTLIYSENLDEYRDLREKWLIKYRKARRNPQYYQVSRRDVVNSPSIVYPGGIHGQSAYVQVPSPESQALSYLAQAGYQGLTVDDLVRLTPRDQFEDELVVMADVRAYFTIAFRRIIDHVPLKVHQTLHRALADRLSVNLLQRLIANAISTGNFAGRMRELVSDDPAIEAKRTRLETTRAQLQEMRRKLDNFATRMA